jgi:hypothetical protein
MRFGTLRWHVWVAVLSNGTRSFDVLPFDSMTRINILFHVPTEHLAVHGTLIHLRKLARWGCEAKSVGMMQQPDSLSLFH